MASHSPQPLACLRHVWRGRGTARPHHAHQLSTCRTVASVQRPAKTFPSAASTSSTYPHLSTISSQLKAARSHQLESRRPYSDTRMSSQFEKILVSQGDGSTRPKKGDTVTMEYTGWLHDPSKPDNRGTQFDSSVGRGDFKTQIGTGKVIQGWDEGVIQMTLGEKSTLIIPGHMAYGSRGFPGIIPPNATLVFDVQLKKIN